MIGGRLLSAYESTGKSEAKKEKDYPDFVVWGYKKPIKAVDVPVNEAWF